MKNPLISFLVLSLLIAVLVIAFVAQIYQQEQKTLKIHLQEKIEQVNSSFDLALLAARQQMVSFAHCAAQKPEIQSTFLAGRKAVAAEGGGAGGVETARMRDKLLLLSQSLLQDFGLGFELLHFHYHLPENVTSFLRVHSPSKYGDSLLSFRHLLSVAQEKKVPISGLEVGRQGLLVRGIAPVFAYDADVDKEIYVGSLEFATSLKQVVENIASNQKVDIAMLLNLDALKKTLWANRLQELIANKLILGNYLIDSTSLSDPIKVLEERHFDNLLGLAEMNLHKHDSAEEYHWMAAFPFHDFWGEHNDELTSLGLILISSDETSNVLSLEQTLRRNIFLAIVGFLFIELALWLALRFTARKLEQKVEEGREQLAQELVAKDELQKQREALIVDLQAALDNVVTLEGLLPVCSYCEKIRNDSGYWQRLEEYIESHSKAKFTHGICNDCLDTHFPDVAEQVKDSTNLDSGV